MNNNCGCVYARVVPLFLETGELFSTQQQQKVAVARIAVGTLKIHNLCELAGANLKISHSLSLCLPRNDIFDKEGREREEGK